MLALPPAARTTREAGISPLPSPGVELEPGDGAVRPIAEAGDRGAQRDHEVAALRPAPGRGSFWMRG